jgi:hypothetical protein
VLVRVVKGIVKMIKTSAVANEAIASVATSGGECISPDATDLAP